MFFCFLFTNLHGSISFSSNLLSLPGAFGISCHVILNHVYTCIVKILCISERKKLNFFLYILVMLLDYSFYYTEMYLSSLWHLEINLLGWFLCCSLQGIVNDQFSHIHHLTIVGRADHFVQLINMYCLDVEAILSQLESYMYLCSSIFELNKLIFFYLDYLNESTYLQ